MRTVIDWDGSEVDYDSAVDYDVDAIVDCLVVMYEREGVEFYRYCFETVVFMNRVVE
jgi:hypothetical protein